MSAPLLVRALREPHAVSADCDWTGLISAARAERLIGTLAYRLAGTPKPERVEQLLAMHRADAEQVRLQALWEAEMTRRALAPLGIPVVLLKGTAFLAAGLEAGQGRAIGDLDILVPREALREVERSLLAHGWERMKEGYDDFYYREWMHELPPLIHRTRDRMIDVHHNILPLTHRSRPLPRNLLDRSIALEGGLSVLSPEHMIVHAAAHLIADGDLAGGLRNLWDIDRLCREFAAADETFYPRLTAEAARHGLHGQTIRALRLSHRLYGSPLGTDPGELLHRGRRTDALFLRRLLARDGWGRPTRAATAFGFYVRSHWMRMPPLMLARHLIRKARHHG